MKRIQINNFFNNHISVNGKKNLSKQPNLFYETVRPDPIVLKQKQEELEEVVSYDTLTPQMKIFSKQQIPQNQKKRTNTIDTTHNNKRAKEAKKSKSKKVSSSNKFRKAVSLERCHEKQISQQQDVSQRSNKNSRKPKSSRNKEEQSQSQSVKRSKSAIIKHSHSKAREGKQVSRQFIKQPKKNMISADNSFKDISKRQIKKETQNLINKKECVDKIECKSARVQSIKIKSRKNNDKIIAEINKSAEKDDKKSFKFSTEKKNTSATASKSYFTSSKQSKPASAREKKLSKKLFNSKQKEHIFEEDAQCYKKLEDFVKYSGTEQKQGVKQALIQLQTVLQGISSKKALAKQLKKFTLKLKSNSSNQKSNGAELSQSQGSNREAFKKIKDFKNNLVKKKLHQAKIFQEQKQSYKDQTSFAKKSSKKLIKTKKKLDDSKRQIQKSPENENIMIKIRKSDHSNEPSQPQFFKNSEELQSKYINSQNVSQFYQISPAIQSSNSSNAVKHERNSDSEILDASNEKYMQFLKNLQAECQMQLKNQQGQPKQKQKSFEGSKNDDLIQDINTYLNKKSLQENKEYNSEKAQVSNDANLMNPMLERRRGEGYPTKSNQQNQLLKNYSSDQEGSDGNLEDQSKNHDSGFHQNKLFQIQELKHFQKQSDQMMSKVGMVKFDQKRKMLTIDLETGYFDNKPNDLDDAFAKTPKSSKYDDRYPLMIKSPKFSDIEITNILSIKEKCLQSKHFKMNELIQKMYEKQLVSPKSYQYYVYQLKKQYEKDNENLDGFKQQASQILHEINQEKNDIKVIDQLLREEKWEEARMLMQGDHKVNSAFFGFKKTKDKIYQVSEYTNSNAYLAEKEFSPSKKSIISVIQNTINIIIKPQTLLRNSLSENHERKNGTKLKLNNGLMKQQKKLQCQYSDDEQNSQNSQNTESITKKLDFQFEQKYKLKSNDDVNSKFFSISQDKVQTQFLCQTVQKANSKEFQNYVYYHNEESQSCQMQLNQKSLSEINQQSKETAFKLYQVPQQKGEIDQEKQQNSFQISLKQQNMVINLKNNNKVIEIDEEESKQILQLQKKERLIEVSSMLNNQKQEEGYESDSSILQFQLRKGFESNLFFIKEYCISLCEYIRDNTQLKNQFKQNISQPLQFQNQDLLKNYRKSIDSHYTNEYNSVLSQLEYKNQLRKSKNKAIPSELAKQFNKTYPSLKFWNKDLNKKNRKKYNMEKEAEAIFLSAILEVLNESLDFQRPGSIFGKPLVWAHNSKHLKNLKYLNGDKTKKVSIDSEESAQTYDFIFGVAIARIIQWGSCLCGFLPDTAELQNTEIDEDYVVHIRQTRMAFLLQKMLAEEQVAFNNSELQETEVMLYLGKAIAEEMIHEASEQFKYLNLIKFQ